LIEYIASNDILLNEVLFVKSKKISSNLAWFWTEVSESPRTKCRWSSLSSRFAFSSPLPKLKKTRWQCIVLDWFHTNDEIRDGTSFKEQTLSFIGLTVTEKFFYWNETDLRKEKLPLSRYCRVLSLLFPSSGISTTSNFLISGIAKTDSSSPRMTFIGGHSPSILKTHSTMLDQIISIFKPAIVNCSKCYAFIQV